MYILNFWYKKITEVGEIERGKEEREGENDSE